MNKTILLTGFEPFGEFDKNPSNDVARALSGSSINGFNIIGITIPYDSRKIEENLIDKISAIAPDIVLMTGQSFLDNNAFFIETRAKNQVDYGINGLCDNTGYRPKNGKIIEGGPEVLHSNVMIGKLEDKLKKEEYLYKFLMTAVIIFAMKHITMCCTDLIKKVLKYYLFTFPLIHKILALRFISYQLKL